MSTGTLFPEAAQQSPSPVAATVQPQQPQSMDPELVRQLRNDTCAVRVHIKKFGVRKALSNEQTEQAAGVFVADKDVLRATKRLLETKGEAFATVLRVLHHAKTYWRISSIPYTEPGWRLIRRSRIEPFRNAMVSFVAELDQARSGLAAAYSALKIEAQEKLGSLFNADDYPASIDGQFSLEWDFPSVDPPDYLRQLNPELYAQQLKLVESRFETSLANAEQLLTEELQKLVVHLADRLKPGDDGKPKQIRATAVENITDFFKRFESLNITSNGSLNQVVKQAQNLIGGVSVDALKSGSAENRATVASSLEELKSALDGMIVNAPRRLINLEDE